MPESLIFQPTAAEVDAGRCEAMGNPDVVVEQVHVLLHGRVNPEWITMHVELFMTHDVARELYGQLGSVLDQLGVLP